VKTEIGARRRRVVRLTLTDLGRLRPTLQQEVADLERRIADALRRSVALTSEAEALAGEAERLTVERDKRRAVLASLDGTHTSTAGAPPTEAEHVPAAEVRRRVLEFLRAPEQAGQTTAVSYIARETGLPRTAVSRACKYLSKETREISEIRRGWYASVAEAQGPSAPQGDTARGSTDDDADTEDPWSLHQEARETLQTGGS
jgi:hypothetical protein